jgi:RHS repeat-associated protein
LIKAGSILDYYSFGSPLPGRSFNTPEYAYGHGGQLADDEITGSRSHYSAEYWEYDSRLGRRWNVDPVTYAFQSPYATFNNNPIAYNDPKGLEGKSGLKGWWKKIKAKWKHSRFKPTKAPDVKRDNSRKRSRGGSGTGLWSKLGDWAQSGINKIGKAVGWATEKIEQVAPDFDIMEDYYRYGASYKAMVPEKDTEPPYDLGGDDAYAETVKLFRYVYRYSIDKLPPEEQDRWKKDPEMGELIDIDAVMDNWDDVGGPGAAGRIRAKSFGNNGEEIAQAKIEIRSAAGLNSVGFFPNKRMAGQPYKYNIAIWSWLGGGANVYGKVAYLSFKNKYEYDQAKKYIQK